jgi:prepilin-type N-terminal cleavage/methylation domain-containing protein
MPRQPRPTVRPHGFTLVELLVVMGVIVLLLAILLPVYASIRRSQKIKRVEAMVQSIASGIESYQNDYGLYPPSDPDDVTLPANNRGNRALVHFLKAGEAQGGRSAPYLPTPFYTQTQHPEIATDVLLDEWEEPLIYFDTSVMEKDYSQNYVLRGRTVAVSPVANDDGEFYNLGRFQLWSCGPDRRNNEGLNLHREGADDLANFTVDQAEGSED